MPTTNQLAYQDYLASVHWADLRDSKFAEVGRKCQVCGCKDRLEVHHDVYRNPLTSCTTADLRVLCRWCHSKQHGISLKRPKTKKRKQRCQRRAKRKMQLSRKEMKNRIRYGEHYFGYVP